MRSWSQLSEGRNENLFDIEILRSSWGVLRRRRRRWIKAVAQHWLKRTDCHTRKYKRQLREGPYLIKQRHEFFVSKVDRQTHLHDPLGPDKHQPLAVMSCSNRGLKGRGDVLIGTARSGHSAVGCRYFENARCVCVETSRKVPR